MNSVLCEILCVLCGKIHITAKNAKFNRKVHKDNYEPAGAFKNKGAHFNLSLS